MLFITFLRMSAPAHTRLAHICRRHHDGCCDEASWRNVPWIIYFHRSVIFARHCFFYFYAPMISTLKEIEIESTGSFPWVIHGTARQNVNKRHFSLMKNMSVLYPNMENVGELHSCSLPAVAMCHSCQHGGSVLCPVLGVVTIYILSSPISTYLHIYISTYLRLLFVVSAVFLRRIFWPKYWAAAGDTRLGPGREGG